MLTYFFFMSSFRAFANFTTSITGASFQSQVRLELFPISSFNAFFVFSNIILIVFKFHILATKREEHVLSTYLPSKVLENPVSQI